MVRLTIFRKIRFLRECYEDHELIIFSRTNKEDQREILCISNLPRQLFIKYGRKSLGLIDEISMEDKYLASLIEQKIGNM